MPAPHVAACPGDDLASTIVFILCNGNATSAPFLYQSHGRSGFYSQLNMFLQQILDHLYRGEGLPVAADDAAAAAADAGARRRRLLHAVYKHSPIVGYGSRSTLGTFVRPAFSCPAPPRALGRSDGGGVVAVGDGGAGCTRPSALSMGAAVATVRGASRYLLASAAIALLFQPRPDMLYRGYSATRRFDAHPRSARPRPAAESAPTEEEEESGRDRPPRGGRHRALRSCLRTR